MMKYGLSLVSLLPLSIYAQQPPNIILFLVDDMGWQETSVPFYQHRTPLNDRYRTPNMERLAQMGVKFTNAYACSVSSPSRCSLMSGMNAARHRVTNWVKGYDEDTNEKAGNIVLPDWNYNGIQPEKARSIGIGHATYVTPLPELLKNAGYITIHCGKGNYGAGNTPGANPLNMGFDINIAGNEMGAPGSYLASEHYGNKSFQVPGLQQYYDKGTFLTEALTQEALLHVGQALEKHKPFFLYMSHYAIHVPYDADLRFTENYREGGMGIYDAQLQKRLDTYEVNHAALIEGMDKSLGDLLDLVQKNDSVAQNTVVIFMLDNGGQSIWPRQGRRHYDQNFPARGGKGSALDGGVHEPMIVSWPGVIKGGTVNENRVMIEDFFPTLLHIAGVTHYKTMQTVDGRDFTDILKNPAKKRDRSIVWHYPNRWIPNDWKDDGFGTYSALMKDRYHLIYFWETGEMQCYDLSQDPTELTNLAAQRPKLLRKMAKTLTAELKKMQAQRPKDPNTQKEMPWPDEAVGTLRK